MSAKQNKRNRSESDRPYDNLFGNFGSHAFESDTQPTYEDRSQGQGLPPPIFESFPNFPRTAVSESPRFSSGSSPYIAGDHPFAANTYGSVPGPAGPSTSTTSHIPSVREREYQSSASGPVFLGSNDIRDALSFSAPLGDKGPNRAASLRRSSGRHRQSVTSQIFG